MTALAGLFVRNAEAKLPPNSRAALQAAISRDPADSRLVFDTDRCFLVKIDVDAFGEPAHEGDGDEVSFIVGDPLLLDANGGVLGRSASVKRLHDAWAADDAGALSTAQGVFSAVHYSRRRQRVSLVSDKVGVRPLYYHLTDDLLVFASALRVLESCKLVLREPDLGAITETSAFGYCLGSRTPYKGISLLRGGGVLHIGAKETRRQVYWHWDDIPESRRAPEDQVVRVYRRFCHAMDRRQRGSRQALAFLSGGLDSRIIVAQLASRCSQLFTFNFSFQGTQDQIFAAQFARRVGTIHREIPRKPVVDHLSLLMADALGAFPEGSGMQHPRLVWSGDGGSCGLGHIYLDKHIVACMRSGNVDGAIDRLFENQHWALPRRILTPSILRQLSRTLQDDIKSELGRLAAPDPGRNFHLFLLLNGQRRLLTQHFEDIDLHKIEFHLPFFDSDFLASVVETPLDFCLGHGLYTKLLALFPPFTVAVPWQTYPGHDPCPLPAVDVPLSQWDKAFQDYIRDFRLAAAARTTEEALQSRCFPYQVLNRRLLSLMSLLGKFGIRDYSHWLAAASPYCEYWQKCNGAPGVEAG